MNAGDKIFQGIVTELLSPLYQLVAVCAVVYFLYGVFMFIKNMNDPDKKNIGKSHLLWGMVGLFIIFSVGGILKVFNTIFGGMFVW